MSSFSQKNLLFETLSWLDGLSLPPPPSSSQTTKLASSNSLTLIKPDISRDLLFKVRPFYLADDYEDMLPSWTDTLYANQTLLMFGFKRWHRYSLKRARRVAYESQILARLPSWRAFVYSARAMDRWKTFSLKHRYLRLQIHAKAKTLKKHLKIKRMVRFWKLWTRRRMRLRRVCFLSWQLHVRRVMKLRKWLLWAKSKECFYAWRRRARWPKVASQWQTHHSKRVLSHWHAISTHPICSRRHQVISIYIAKAYLLHTYLHNWIHHTRLYKSYQQQQQMLMQVRKQELVSVLRTWIGWTCRQIEQHSMLQNMYVHYCRNVYRQLLDSLYDRQNSRRTYKYAYARHTKRMMQKELMTWYKHIHKHSIRNGQQQIVYKDSLLHYAHKYFQQYRCRVWYMRKQRISSLAYVRSTIRFYLSVWRDRVATHERARVLTGRAAKYYKNKAFWSILRRLRQLTALRWKRRRQCELACIHVYIRRYYRHIQKVLQQKYSLERAQQRYEVSSTWGSWQRWRRRTARHEQLRRLYNIYRFKQLAKGTFSGVGARSTVWSRGVTGLSLFDQVDKDQAEIQRRTLLVQVFYAWKLRFVPMQRKEKSLFGTVMFKHFAYLCRRVLLRWHAVYEDVSVVRGKLHNAICKWWDCLVARRNQRKLLVRHGVVYTNRLKVHRLLYRWRNRVMSHYKCMRSASLQKHYVLREFSSMQHAVHTIQCTRNFYVRKTFLHIWYAVYRERQNNLRPFVTRIALRHMWREWVARYNDAVMYASLSLSHAQQPKRKLIDLKSTPVVDKENSRENKQRSLLLKRQVDFSYTTIHPTSIHDDLYIVSAVSSSHAVLPQPRTVDKEALARGYVKQFEKRKQSSRKECSFSGMSFVS